MKFLKIKQISFVLLVQLFITNSFAQYKEFLLNAKGDTINAVTNAGKREGKWVIHYDEIRGEPGYEEEGIYKKGEKDGIWRRYNLEGDIIGVENYKLGGKDGLQQYYTYLGDLVREENWKGYNPDAPYDTIAIYGTGSGEIVDYKIVKAEPYSVKDGEWRYFEAGSGRIIKVEKWNRNVLELPNSPKPVVTTDEKPKKTEKTAEMIQWERKNSGKKKALREGRTGL